MTNRERCGLKSSPIFIEHTKHIELQESVNTLNSLRIDCRDIELHSAVYQLIEWGKENKTD